MIREGKSKMTALGVAFLTAGSLYLLGASEAQAKTVVVRPGDRVVYREPVRRDWWRDRGYYRSYDRTPPARWQGPPPWAASWYRSRQWRDRDDRREDRNNYWRWHRRDRD
jgi:hypothetical protein